MIITHNSIKYEFNMPKILFTNDIFGLIKNIYKNNSKVIFINPLTKISELLDIKTSSPFLSYLSIYMDKPLVDENLIEKLYLNIFNDLGDVADFGNNDFKILKSIIEIKDKYVDEEFIEKYLSKMSKYLSGFTIVCQGFENKIKDFIKASNNYLNIFHISNNLSKMNLTK